MDWRSAHNDAVAAGRRVKIKRALRSLGTDVKRVAALPLPARLSAIAATLAKHGVVDATVPEVVAGIDELVADLEAEAAAFQREIDR